MLQKVSFRGDHANVKDTFLLSIEDERVCLELPWLILSIWQGIFNQRGCVK